MKSLLVLMVSVSVLSGAAEAQTTARGGTGSAEPATWYVEGVAQSALSNVQSQSYGAEAGLTVATNLQVFVDAGRIRDVATSDLGINAATVAAALNLSQQNSLPFLASVKEPVTFGVAGVKYLIPVASKVEPYVMGGFGVARYTKDVHFLLGGTDVTQSLAQYYVVLGSDLSGDFTRPMLSLGLGVTWPAWERLIVDFQYRYGRIFADDQGINVSRIGVGVGVRF